MEKGKLTLNRKIEISRNILAELVNYLLLFTLQYVLMEDFVRQQAIVPELILMGFVPLFYYLLREKCKNLLLFLFLHLLPLILLILFYYESAAQKMIMTAVLILCMLLSIARRINSNQWGMEACMPPAGLGLILLLYLLDATQAYKGCVMFLFRMAVLYMMAYLIYYFLQRFLHYIDVNNRTAENIPVNHVFASAAGLASAFTITAGALVIFSADRELIDKISAVFRKLFVDFISFLLSLIPEKIETEYIATQEAEDGFLEFLLMMGMPKSPSWLIEALNFLLTVFGIAVELLLVVGMTLGLIKMIRSGFAGKQRFNRVEDESGNDRVESLERKKIKDADATEQSPWRRLQNAFTSEEKIRKLYRKLMNDGYSRKDEEIQKKVTGQATAREALELYFPDAETEAVEFAGLYEKARYGAGLCTRADVKRAGILMKELTEKG